MKYPRQTFAACALAWLAAAVCAAPAPSAVPAGAATARVIVKLKPGASLLRKQATGAVDPHAEQAQALGARLGLPLASGTAVGERTHVVFASGMSSESLAERLSRDAEVEYAVPDRRKFRAAAPNDPLYASAPSQAPLTGGPVVGQWYLRAPGGGAVAAINAEAAWNTSTGRSTVVVAVLDTGIRFDHADLKRVADGGNLLDGYDMVGEDRTDSGVGLGTFLSAKDGNGRDANAGDPGDGITSAETNDAGGLFYHCTSPVGGQYPEETSSWHGTQTAGLIGALTNNGVGMASVGRTVRILPVRVLSKCGGWDSDILAGMRWAAGLPVDGAPDNPNPAQVINLSLGGGTGCSAAYADAVKAILARGATIVVSAGNGAGHAVDEPASCAGVIGVAGVRHVGTKVGFSNVGPQISLSAPGGNCVNEAADEPCLYPILTTTNRGAFDPVSNVNGGSTYTDAFNVSVGTSFSAPLVAGTAALMLSVHPDLSPAAVRARLRSTARAFPSSGGSAGTPACRAPGSADQLECYCTTSTCGAGMLDTAVAVQAALAPSADIAVDTETPLPGLPLELSAAAVSVATGRSVKSYRWTISGSRVVPDTDASGPTLTVVPNDAGRFNVRLTVTDSAEAQTSIDASVDVEGSGGGGALGADWLLLLATAIGVLRRGRPGEVSR